jgi:hypothetical protein
MSFSALVSVYDMNMCAIKQEVGVVAVLSMWILRLTCFPSQHTLSEHVETVQGSVKRFAND